jgi:bacterioferritin-associated ferredoxin
MVKDADILDNDDESGYYASTGVTDKELEQALDNHCENARQKMEKLLSDDKKPRHLIPTDAEWTEVQRLYRAVDLFVEEMKIRLREKVLAGSSGWDDPNFLPTSDISFEMQLDSLALDSYYCMPADEKISFNKEEALTLSVDVANRAMMLWVREKEEIKSKYNIQNPNSPFELKSDKEIQGAIARHCETSKKLAE